MAPGSFPAAAATHVAELDLPQLAQLADTAVGGLGLQEELRQGHLLAAEQLPHGAAGVPEGTNGEKGGGGGGADRPQPDPSRRRWRLRGSRPGPGKTR